MAKRSNGEGSYDWLEIKGKRYRRWRGMYGYDDKTGKPKKKVIYAATDKECREKVRQFLKDLEAGVDVTKSLTVAEWCDIWLRECCGDLKAKSLQKYESTIRVHIKPRLGSIKLDKLKPAQVQQFVNDLPGVPKSVRSTHGILHAILKKAVIWRMIVYNPADNMVLPKLERHEMNYIADESLKAFLTGIAGDQFEDMYKTAVLTGLRIGEICGLSWANVDLDDGTIRVAQQIQLIKGKYVIETPKTNNGIRTITIPPFVIDTLKHRRRVQAEHKLRAGELWNNEHDLVFTKENGEPVSFNTVRKHLKACLAKAGLNPDIRFHDLRHSFACFSLENGDSMKQVQENLGHYSVAFTSDTYAHLTEKARRESAARHEQGIRALLGE